MENIIAEEDLDDISEGGAARKDIFSPSQPVLLSQKAGLLQEAVAQTKEQQGSSCSLDDMLGEKIKGKQQTAVEVEAQFNSQIRIANNDEKISNSSTPQQNEKL